MKFYMIFCQATGGFVMYKHTSRSFYATGCSAACGERFRHRHDAFAAVNEIVEDKSSGLNTEDFEIIRFGPVQY